VLLLNFKKIVWIVAVGIVCLIAAISFYLLNKDIWDKNEDLFKEKVVSIRPSADTVYLRDVTPFEWDEVYTFPPYTPKESIYKTVGYKWDTISETVNEGMDQVVFMKKGKVVCYLYGYPNNNGYGLSFQSDKYKGSAAVLNVKDDLTFQIEHSGGVVYLHN
jgi:hypothetical protein